MAEAGGEDKEESADKQPRDLKEMSGLFMGLITLAGKVLDTL